MAEFGIYTTIIAIVILLVSGGVTIYLMPIWPHSKDYGYIPASRASLVFSLIVAMILIAWVRAR